MNVLPSSGSMGGCLLNAMHGGLDGVKMLFLGFSSPVISILCTIRTWLDR